MDYDERNTDELEAELYSRIHHDQPETVETVTDPPPPFQCNRTVTKHSVINNSSSSHNKMNKKSLTKCRKKVIEKCNPNPFAIASAMNNQIPKRLTPYTSYLSQVDSKPIDLPPVQVNENAKEIEQTQNERRPNPFNQGFNRTEEKMKRYQQIQAKKAHANKIRHDIQQKNQQCTTTITTTTDGVLVQNETPNANKPSDSVALIADSDSDDEVYIYPPEEPTVISSDDDEDDDPNVTTEPEKEPELESAVSLHHDECDEINVDYDKRLSRHDDPFGGIDVAHLNAIISPTTLTNRPPATESSDHFAKPQRTNRHSLKRSYDVSETDFAATDVYESESSDLPENNVSKSRKVAEVLSASEGSDVDTARRSKRMRKRRKSGSNRGSDYISSDDSDDDGEVYLEPEKTQRPYYLHRGEGVFNAVTKYSKRLASKRTDQNRDISLDAMDSSDDSHANGAEEEQENIEKENWTVTDAVGETDNVPIELNTLNENGTEADVDENCADANVNEQDNNESNVDKDDDNSVRSKRLVIHPEMGWNDEMKAFYNDSWGGETHNASAIRKQMPKDQTEWRLHPKDLRSNYNLLKSIKCHNCRENGHRMAFCPQPKKEVVCYTCGNAGHREVRCPHAICLKCGEKTNSYRRGCESCFRLSHVICNKCRRRGHVARECPDNWRAYHNTTDPVSAPVCLPAIRSKRFCSACATYGHRAEQCYDFKLLMQDYPIPTDIKNYKKIYPDPITPIDNSGSTPYSMFENPRTDFKFIWNVNESSDRVYGRFMEAANIKRDPVDNVDTKRRKKAKIPKLNDNNMVLNPMNAENIREKPKKQFAKNFYEELTSTPNKVDQQIDSECVFPTSTAAVRETETIHENSIESEHDNDVVMKELDPIETPVSTVANENGDETTATEQPINDSITEDRIMQEAIEVDQLRGSINFSFSKEMHDLEKSKALFDLSFIGTGDETSEEINDNPTTSKASVRKMRKVSEIEQLTEMEMDQLSGSINFSFSKEMNDLERSKALFDLSFVGTGDETSEEINDNPTTSKASVRKMRKVAEIEQLTEMEISLNKLKDKLSKKKANDDIVLNVSNDHSIHCVHDSDSNYSFGEYFNESKSKDDSVTVETPDYIPLPPHIDSSDIAAVSETVTPLQLPARNSAKIFLTKQHARLLLSTEAGNKLLSDASVTHQVKVRMDWENLGNVLIVVGSTANQNKFHADLIRFLVEMCKKMRIKNETFQQIPRSKVALIRFIRDQFALLEQPLGNVNELYKNMKRNESLKSKNGTKNADRARKHLNIILLGRAGLRDGRLHLTGLESNLRFLLENNKDLMTKHTREEIYQHYRYVFSPFEHDDYPDLIAEYEEMKRAKSFPPLNIDKKLFEIKISVKDDEGGDLNRAKQKLMRVSNDNNESPTNIHENVDSGSTTLLDAVLMSEPKTPTREFRNLKREPKSPKQQPKSPKLESKAPNLQTQSENIESVNASTAASPADDNSSNLNKNAVWSLKCKDIVEQCRQKHIKSSKVVDKLNTILEKASRNQLSYTDYKNLEKILNTLNRTVN